MYGRHARCYKYVREPRTYAYRLRDKITFSLRDVDMRRAYLVSDYYVTL